MIPWIVGAFVLLYFIVGEFLCEMVWRRDMSRGQKLRALAVILIWPRFLFGGDE